MDLLAFDNQSVRITLKNGEVFDGAATYDSDEYCMHILGVGEQALEIDNWVFYESDIESVVPLEGEPRLWLGRPMHRMKLWHEPYAMVESGQKTIELRLYDEKRMRIKIGDVIRFEDTEDNTEVLFAQVEKLHVFRNFAELYRALPLTECGYTEESAKTASPHDMDAYYSEREQQRYGAVGIRISLL